MKKLSLLAATGLTLAGVAAFAAPNMGGAGKGDADGNGLISKAEAMAQAERRFARMDSNEDGQVNAADREAHLKSRFAEMDADKNGSISEAEFIAGHQKRMEGGGMRAMRGGEGHHGMRHGGKGGGHMMMMGADANKDGSITRAEMQAAVEAHFTKADANKDGSISADERKAARAAMRRMAPPPPAE